MSGHLRRQRRRWIRDGLETLESRRLLAQVNVDTSQSLGTISNELAGSNVLYAYERDAVWQDGRVADLLQQVTRGSCDIPAASLPQPGIGTIRSASLESIRGIPKPRWIHCRT